MIKIYTDTSLNKNTATCTSLILSETNFIGLVTNEYKDVYGSIHGELLAILQGLKRLEGCAEPIEVYTDSKEAIAHINRSITSNKLQDLIGEINQYKNVAYKYIKGHTIEHSPNKVVDIISRRVSSTV